MTDASGLAITLWILGLGLGLFLLDRLLLWVERRGWIYYRKSKPGRGASTYHLFQWNAILDPSFREVLEERVKEERQEDDSGAPPGSSEPDEQSAGS